MSTKVLKIDIGSKFRLFQQYSNSGDTILACPVLAKEQYIKRCDGVCAKYTLTCVGNRDRIRQRTLVRGGADKSLARPGRKQATATKLGIYSTYSP